MNYTSITQQQYEDLRYEYLKQVEEGGHENPQPYYDSNGLITIGVGFNLHAPATLEVFLSTAMGVSDRITLNHYASRIATVLNQYRLQSSGSASQTASMQQALNAEWASLTGSPNAQFVVTDRGGQTAQQLIRSTFDTLVDSIYEDTLENRLTNRGITGLSNGDYSYERLVLLSLEYNNGNQLIGNGLLTALANGDRFAAWYEIRYRSNGDALPGIAKRRYMESELFGLFDDPGSVDDAQAANVVDSFLRPDVISRIISYEATYRSQVAVASSELSLIGVGNTVKALDQIFLPISNYLYQRYGESSLSNLPPLPTIDGRVVLNFTQGGSNTIQSSVVGVAGQDRNDLLINLDGSGRILNGGLGNDILISKNSADTLRGGEGSDILIAGEGNDVLEGGKGADYLYGGEGEDTLYAQTSSASDEMDMNILYGGNGSDKLYGASGADVLMGESGNDTIHGRNGDDIIHGGDDNDELHGELGDDVIWGDGGSDTLHGGVGNDFLGGGEGQDLLYGGKDYDGRLQELSATRLLN